MSTERKPGSRGTLNTFTRDRANPLPRGIQAPEKHDDEAPAKGSTKTESPRKGFKKRKK